MTRPLRSQNDRSAVVETFRPLCVHFDSKDCECLPMLIMRPGTALLKLYCLRYRNEFTLQE